jgi:hypothetical protein
MPNWRDDRDDDRSGYDRGRTTNWEDWRERDRGMLGRQSYGRSAPAGGDYAGGRGYSTGDRGYSSGDRGYSGGDRGREFDRDRWNPEDMSREGRSGRTWARDYMPDRGYSAYGGDFNRSRTSRDREYGSYDPRNRDFNTSAPRDRVMGDYGRDRGYGRPESYDRGRPWEERDDRPRYGRDRDDWRDRDDDTRSRDEFTRRLDPDRYDDDDYPWNMYGRETRREPEYRDDDRWFDRDRDRDRNGGRGRW